jgi:hypothetical protein
MAVISLALCMVSVASVAWADDCGDALIAESCACQSTVRGKHEKVSALHKTSLGKKEAKARNRVKMHIARGSNPSGGSNKNVVEK